jgi:hypothetical protein
LKYPAASRCAAAHSLGICDLSIVYNFRYYLTCNNNNPIIIAGFETCFYVVRYLDTTAPYLPQKKAMNGRNLKEGQWEDREQKIK